MENLSTYLRRAAIGYLIASMGFLAFGFPFWFLNAVDHVAAGHSYAPFFFVFDDPLTAPLTRWAEFLGPSGLLVGGISLWKVGEPTGMKRRNVLLVPIAGAISYLLSVWVLLPFAPLGALLNGLGMILVGIATLRATIWTGWKRYIPLCVGCFPFVFMYPLLIITGARPPAMIGLWGLMWLTLSFAVWQRSKEISQTKSMLI